MNPYNKRHRGFTLTEIIVVTALVGTITGLLFPALASARRKGRDATCLSNLRQIGIATRLYADDNDGRYPYAIDPQSRKSPLASFVPPELIDELPNYSTVLSPYLKATGIFHCPSDQDGQFEKWKTSYSYNESLIFYHSWDKVQAANASRVSLYLDSGNWHGMTDNPISGDYFVQAVYADLHVKRLRVEQLSEEELAELGEEGVEKSE